MCQYIVAEFQNDSLTKEDLLERIAQFEISEGPMGLRGKRIEHPPQQNLLSGLPELEENGYIPLRTVADLLRDIALFCTRNPDEELEKAYVLLLRYLMVQGYADGSSMGHHMLMDYGMRPFYNSFLLMKRTIERAGLVKPLLEALRWFLHMGKRGFLEGQGMEHSSADDFNNLSQGTLATILLMEEEKEKAAWLRADAVRGFPLTWRVQRVLAGYVQRRWVYLPPLWALSGLWARRFAGPCTCGICAGGNCI